MRILLIEDDSGLGSAVRDQLEAEGHSPDWVQTLATRATRRGWCPMT